MALKPSLFELMVLDSQNQASGESLGKTIKWSQPDRRAPQVSSDRASRKALRVLRKCSHAAGEVGEAPEM